MMIGGNYVMFVCLFISKLDLINFSFGLGALKIGGDLLIRLGRVLGMGVLGWFVVGIMGNLLINIISLSLIEVGIFVLVAISCYRLTINCVVLSFLIVVMAILNISRPYKFLYKMIIGWKLSSIIIKIHFINIYRKSKKRGITIITKSPHP